MEETRSSVQSQETTRFSRGIRRTETTPTTNSQCLKVGVCSCTRTNRLHDRYGRPTVGCPLVRVKRDYNLFMGRDYVRLVELGKER